ncbi:Uncharacterised protein [uncultured archaeon]|nr:Uncharacterised protein [uncultured archaeon]
MYAVLAGVLLALLWAGLTHYVLKSPAKQSYEYWTMEASPWRIANQYLAADSKVQVIELVNEAGVPLFLKQVDVNGTHGAGSLKLEPNRFGPGESKLVMVPVQTPCLVNETFSYRLRVAYAKQAQTNETETEEGRLPVYGRCE